MKTIMRTMKMAFVTGIPYRYVFLKAEGIKI